MNLINLTEIRPGNPLTKRQRQFLNLLIRQREQHRLNLESDPFLDANAVAKKIGVAAGEVNRIMGDLQLKLPCTPHKWRVKGTKAEGRGRHAKSGKVWEIFLKKAE